MTTKQSTPAWRIELHGDYLEGKRIEVFISPEGHWYRRAKKRERADLEVPSKISGLAPTRLVNIDHWRPTP